MSERTSFAYLVPVICGAHLLTMVGVFAFPGMLPQFFAEWDITNSEAGWIAGIRYGGYAAGVPLLVSITDRLDARRIYMLGALISAAGFAGFALFAEGFWTALLFEGVAGFGLAATYMPGLRMLMDRYSGGRQPRAVAFYTASFSAGVAISYFLAGEVGGAFGWQTMFWVGAASAALAFVVALLGLNAVTPQPAEDQAAFFDVRPVIRNRRAMGYIVAYFAHSWELFAYRGWLVAFLAFALAQDPGTEALVSPTLAATLTGIAAMFASLGGAEIADKMGRRGTLTVYGALSGLAALCVGFLPGFDYHLIVAAMIGYAMLIQLDSAALTTGTVLAAETGKRGVTLAFHSFLGFLGGFAGPAVLGMVLDLTGGGAGAMSWGIAFASAGVAALIAPIALMTLKARAA